MINYPDQNWFDETTQYNIHQNISCPKCYEFEQNEDMEGKVCPLCNAEDFSIGYSYYINVEKILKNLEEFKKLNDSQIKEVLYDFNKQTYECPDCSSIDDDQYTCTICWGETFNEVHRFVLYLSSIDKEFAEKISNLYEEL